ncbi:Uma2 family endonuclease [Planctomicrobium sp. SH661]|uniref:Uma2 family endonuclease n=1 Tax=Planctomicrobium sp. SH661 TaxID=3448124 RepID=UPI003F5C010E
MTLLTELLPQASLSPLSVAQYHAMIQGGILPEGEPLELIDGLLIRKDRRDSRGDIMTVGPRHAKVTKLLVRMLNRLLTSGEVYVQSQLPITLSDQCEPEPDVAVILGDEADESFDHHPSPPGVLLVIEVSDSSLIWDRTSKLRIYAEAEIPEYWIVNLAAGVIEVYRNPDVESHCYREQIDVLPAESLHFKICDQSFSFQAGEVLG